jgi:hypothetical protein
VLSNGTNLRDVPFDIGGNELAVAAHPALKIDKMGVVADALEACLDLLTVRSRRGLAHLCEYLACRQ